MERPWILVVSDEDPCGRVAIDVGETVEGKMMNAALHGDLKLEVHGGGRRRASEHDDGVRPGGTRGPKP